MAPLLLDLHQMVDLALSTSDSGVVNVSVLHALLHVIIHKLEVQSYRVEFRGKGGQEIEHSIPTIPLANVVSVTEYAIANPDLLQERTAISESNTGNIINTILSVNIPAENSDGNRLPPGFPLVPLNVPINDTQCKDNSIHDMLAVTLPADHELLGIPQPEPPESLTIMWGMINVSKRVDAVEIGLQRLAELLQAFGKDLHQMTGSHGSGKHQRLSEERKARKIMGMKKANIDENDITSKNKYKKKKPEELGIDGMSRERKNSANEKIQTDDNVDENEITRKNKNKKKKPEELGIDRMRTERQNSANENIQTDANKEQSSVDSNSKSKTKVSNIGPSISVNNFGHVNFSDTSINSTNFGEDSDDYESGNSTIFQREIQLNLKKDILAEQTKRIDHITNVLNGQLSDLRSAITDEYTTQYSKFNTVFMQTMQEIQDMLDAKVDKLCIPPLKQYIADELLGFRKHLEMFAQEFGMIPDAAGTQVIRNVNCISCERTVNQKDREKQILPLMDRSRPLKFVQTSNDKVKHRNYGGSTTMTTANERIFRKSNIVTGQSFPQHEYTTECGNNGKIYQSAKAVMCSCNRKNVMT